MLKYAWLTIVVGVVIGMASIVLGARALRADTAPSVAVNPALVAELYSQPTPITITINASGLSGAGLTPVGAYQYGLEWNPAVLQWLSGPDVGPGTPTPQPVLPGCMQIVTTWGLMPTPWPTGFVPTDTPTPTDTPGAGTPTDSPTPTSSPAPTNTPGGYIQVACVTLPGAPTPLASGVLGTFTFRPLATAQASSALNLLNVKLVDAAGEYVTPGPVVSSGVVNLLADTDGDGCPDARKDVVGAGAELFGGNRDKTSPWDWYEDPYDGDTLVDYDDVLTVLGHFGEVPGDPAYSVAYDRSAPTEQPWQTNAPDGIIDFDDVFGEFAQFGSLCP